MEGMLILSIISLCLLHYSGAQTLQLQPPQQDQEKVLKKGLVQTCSAVGLGPGEDPQLTWTNSQGQIVTSTNSNDQVYVEGKGTQSLKLKIKAVRGEHDGKWICTGVIGGVTKTTFVTFSVWEDISFEGDLEQRPTIYTDALIKCVVSGTPQPKVSWAKDKKELNKGRYMPVGDGLKILNITKNDNGEYLCKAEIPGRGRYEERIITVEVKVPPTMTSPPKMTLGIKGSDVTMRCQASGDPTPTYKWYRDQRGSYVELNNGGRYEISKVEGTFKILRVEENDDGTYKCVATNLAASVEGTADIDVLVPPKIQPITAGEGSAMGTVKMHCVATGDPPPEMKWQKVGNYAPYTGGPNGQAIADKTNSRVTIVQTKDSDRTRLEMQIDRLEPSDIGNYTCFAHSQAGNDTMNSTLNVYFKPEFTNNPSDVAYSWSGAQHRNVTCIVDSNPAAVVTWERNGEVLKNNNTYTIHTVDRPRQVESNLTVVVDFTNAEYIFGDYVCKARNNKGEGQVVIDLRKADKPHPPSDVEVIRESQTWFRLRVGAPVQDGGMPVTGFQIIYSSPTDDRGQQTLYQKINTERINDDDARPKTSVDIRGLQPSSLYTILVSAITEVGHSDEYEFQRTTKRVSVPDPLEIRSKTVSETATVYKLTWEKPNDGGSRILRYVIRYRQVVVNDTTNQIIQVKGDYKERVETNPEATSYNLDKLVSKETYQIEVYAVNGVGNSEKRHIIVKTRSGPEAGGVVGTPQADPPGKVAAPDSVDPTDAVVVDPGLSTGAIVGLVIIIFFILLLIVDVTCYFKNRCGIIMCVRENVCGAGAGDEDRQATLEDGDAKETQPLAEKEKPDMETKVGGAENQAGVVEDEKKQPLLDNEDKGPGDETATEAEEPEKMEEKEPEDKDERILEPQVEAGKEAQEAPSATTPEAEVKPGTESPTPPAEKA